MDKRSWGEKNISDNLRKIVMKSFEKLSSNSINFVNNELIKIATNTKKTFNNDEYLKKLFLGFYEKYDKYIYQEYKDKDKDGFIDTYEFRMYIAKFLRYLGIKCLDIIYFNNTILFNFLAILIGLPIWSGRKVYVRYKTIGKHKRNL